MKSCSVLVALMLAACSGDDGGAGADAAPRSDAAPSCPAPATPLANGMHTLYLAFEGVTLSFGDCDDSRTNCSSLVAQPSTVVPAFLQGQGNRQTRVTTIAGMVQEALAPFSIDVVTTRPTTGDYWMVTLGGTSTALIGTTNALLAAKPVCNAMNRNSIGLVFEQADVEYSDRAYADTAAGALGRLVGMVPTTRNGDCMCVQSTCTHVQGCTWATGAVTQAGNECMRTIQNEQLLMIDAVGCR